MIDLKASTATLNNRGGMSGAENDEARDAMATTQRTAEQKVDQLLDDCFSGARVLQGGGSEINGNKLEEMILEAAKGSLTRLYPKFITADTLGWDKVYTKAKKGAPDALKSVGYDGEPQKNAVCKAILGFLGPGKKGTEIRSQFSDPEYGWQKDAIEGALQVLLVAGLVRAHNDQGAVIEPTDLERKNIGKSTFKVESTVVGTPERIQIRKVLQAADIRNVTSGEELAAVPQFIAAMGTLRQSAGGEAPCPELPDESAIEAVRLASGNEQLMAIYNSRDELKQAITDWRQTADGIAERYPVWQQLESLMNHAGQLSELDSLKQQVEAVREKRMLLAEPDPVTPLLKSAEDATAELCHRKALGVC